MTRAVVRVATVAALVSIASPGLAQIGATPGTSGGLFGGTRPESGRRRDVVTMILDVNQTANPASQSALSSELPESQVRLPGSFTTMSATADYQRVRRQAQFAFSGYDSFRYDPSLQRVDQVTRGASLLATVDLPKRGILHVDQTAAFSPSYLYRLFPVVDAPPAGQNQPTTDYRVDTIDSRSYDTRATLTFGSVRGTRIEGRGDYSRTSFEQSAQLRPDTRTASAELALLRALSRRTGLTFEYRLRNSEFGAGGATQEQTAAFGGEYTPRIWGGRATIRGRVAPSLLTVTAPAGAVGGSAGNSDDPEATPRSRRSAFQTELSFAYGARRWRLSSIYRRSLEHLGGVRGPLLSDGASLEFTRLITRRIDVSMRGSYAEGVSVVPSTSSDLRTYTGNVRVRYAVSRSTAVYSEYQTYHYDVHGQAQLAPQLGPAYDQRYFRAGIVLFAQPFRR